ncbi:hypothetical protein B6U82_00305 [Candidatus Pacearchaeota archaeon ex4484_31]|nr:MAG: hypothetical protein B6U82_00305 [Candidatus Pacearchaeota archaeon ex4484_31]
MDDEIFRISKDKERAKDLFEMAKERLELLKLIPKDKAYKIIEEYYEVIKELLTAVMYIDGYKTLSHIKLIEYFSSNYKELDENQIKLIDTLRKFRIGIVYYGRKISQEFLINNEDEIKSIISILMKIIRRKLSL